MIIYITRHGQPWLSGMEGHPGGSDRDSQLTALGRTQARLLGERLRDLGFSGRICVSPYLRTMETGAIIAEATGLPFRPEPAIREIATASENMLTYRGQTLAEMRARYPGLAADAALPYPWWGTIVEDANAVLARVGAFLGPLIASERGDILLVGHGASVGAIHRYLLEGYPDDLRRKGNDWNCCLSALRVKPRFEALLLSDTSHLAAEQVTSNRKALAEWQREQAAARVAPVEAGQRKPWDWTV